MKESYNPLSFLHLLKFSGAIIIAIIFHSVIDIFPDNSVFMYLKSYGRIFVEMFFIISGMLFYLHYYNRLYNKELKYSTFTWKRFIRLYPIMTISTLFMFVVYLIQTYQTGSQVGNINIFHLFTSLLFGSLDAFGGRSLNGNLWYVAVLLLCYFISCLITWLASKHEIKTTIPFAIPFLTGILMYIMHRNSITGIFWTDALPRGLICYFFGIFLGQFLIFFNKKQSLLFRLVALFIFALTLTLMLLKPIRENSLKSDYTISFGVLLFSSLIVSCYDVKWLNKLQSNKFFSLLGSISFPIYVFNKPILIFLGNSFVNSTTPPDKDGPILLFCLSHT